MLLMHKVLSLTKTFWTQKNLLYYNAKVNSAMKKAQFDSYVPQKTAAPETAPEIKQEVKPEVTDTEKLKTSIDSYFKNKATEKVG
ncbi:MAG: hypothetical protein A2039_04895 [Candidatus Melainabacteria bacterium GWA2_34_9]|nr:MAG: hypothetical protein A2039_04895 [Candidatus Melainabacteria bacterium GWA2_34_9]